MNSPAWIEMLYKRGHGLNAFSTQFLFNCHKDDIHEEISIAEGRSEQLRQASLARLDSEEIRPIIQSLSFLLVVGKPEDLETIEPFVNHSDIRVQRAAKTCCFELKH